MKTRQEQIEELAGRLVELGELLSLAYAEEVCRGFDKRNKDSYYIEISEKLYSEGYRKASDVIDEFASSLKNSIIINDLDKEPREVLLAEIDELAVEMRQEVEK